MNLNFNKSLSFPFPFPFSYIPFPFPFFSFFPFPCLSLSFPSTSPHLSFYIFLTSSVLLLLCYFLILLVSVTKWKGEAPPMERLTVTMVESRKQNRELKLHLPARCLLGGRWLLILLPFPFFTFAVSQAVSLPWVSLFRSRVFRYVSHSVASLVYVWHPSGYRKSWHIAFLSTAAAHIRKRDRYQLWKFRLFLIERMSGKYFKYVSVQPEYVIVLRWPAYVLFTVTAAGSDTRLWHAETLIETFGYWSGYIATGFGLFSPLHCKAKIFSVQKGS